MNESPYVFEVTEDNFASVVLENSKKALVVVDFWAEWCGPCKMLMPVLDKLVNEYQGKLIIAKVDTEQQQALAAQHGIRSIPTLKFFKDARQVEEIHGAQPEPVLRQAIDQYITRESDIIRAQAISAYQQGNAEKALDLLDAAAKKDPDNYQIVVDRARIFLGMGKLDDVQALLQTLPLAISEQPEVGALQASLEFARTAKDASSPSVLESTISADPKNCEARYQMGARKVLEGDYEGALEQFLEILRRDRNFKDDAGRRAMIAVFNMLNNEGELVTRYRKRMFNALH